MHFAEFEVDADAGELRRRGELVKIQDLPFRILVVLLTHAGQVVTREQLRQALWGAETFVDAEAGLNTAIAKLREALGDSADAPRFIQTLPKRGYRWIGNTAPVVAAATAQASASFGRSWSAARRPLAIATTLLLAVIAFVIWRERSSLAHVTIAVVLFHNETGDAAYDQLAQQLTDGTVVVLAANRRFDVIGNAAILRTPRIFADIQLIGKALRADYLVLGQVQRVNGELTVRAHFIRVLDQKHLWAQGIAGDPAGLDNLVPQTIADAVDVALAGRPQ